jgi:putative oxidoreductase
LKWFYRLEPFGLLLLRAALGIVFIVHGYPKLVHPQNMQGLYVQHGMPAYSVYVSGVLELFGGGLLIFGLFTQVAAFLLGFEMAVMIWKVYASRSYLAVQEYEFPLILATACLALATVGAGSVSIDNVLLGSSKSAAPRSTRK